ncbi:MAG: hypothetical protein A3I02_11540 [Betaproteobacteria bacterium RIFCSPLOWO2_02_FULL_67_26]|nr:MAG: hypothetical protein A3I02_11540 [Betaproteobacteria bacterium RIFCSPLOWO2_02_FULL_67_26]
MSASFWIAFWWSAFVGTHIVLSALPVRQRLVAALGEKTFLGLYSLIALATFVPLVSVYLDHRHAGGLLWYLVAAQGVRHLAMLLAVLGIALVVAAVLQPSPALVGMKGAPVTRGLVRITRHPLFMGIALWAGAHLLLNGYATDVLFFGGLLFFSLIGARHQDDRKRVTDRERLGPFFAETSFWPFVAILAGRNTLVWRELPWLALVIGAAAAVGIYALHPWMFR